MALHDWLARLRSLITPAARGAAGPPAEGAGPESEDTALPPEALWSPEARRGGHAGRTRLLLGVILLAGGAWLGLRYLAAPSPPPPLGSLITAPGRLPAPVPKTQEGNEPARPPAPGAAEAPAPAEPAPAPRVGRPAEPPPSPAAPPALDRAEPPPALGLARESQALAEDTVRMSYALTLAEREMRLAEFGARKQKAEAERAKAAADAKEAAAWIAALERDPKLAIRMRLPEKEKTEPKVAGPVVPGRAGAATLPTFPALPLSPPPPPAPKVEAPPPPPMPPAETIMVRLIDDSAPEGPEALLAVNGQTVAVRLGDQVGAWEVVAVTPAGVQLAADYGGVRQEQWRPLPAPFAQGSAVLAAPPAPAKLSAPAALTPAQKAAPAATAPPHRPGPSRY